MTTQTQQPSITRLSEHRMLTTCSMCRHERSCDSFLISGGTIYLICGLDCWYRMLAQLQQAVLTALFPC